MVDDENGFPILKVVFGGANGREEYFLKYGDQVSIQGTLFNFTDVENPAAINIKYENEKLLAKTAARCSFFLCFESIL